MYLDKIIVIGAVSFSADSWSYTLVMHTIRGLAIYVVHTINFNANNGQSELMAMSLSNIAFTDTTDADKQSCDELTRYYFPIIDTDGRY